MFAAELRLKFGFSFRVAGVSSDRRPVFSLGEGLHASVPCLLAASLDSSSLGRLRVISLPFSRSRLDDCAEVSWSFHTYVLNYE